MITTERQVKPFLKWAGGKGQLIDQIAPYRPISATAGFTSYSKDTFDDFEQKRLRKVFGELDKKDACVMLSNSDPENGDPEDNFFDNLYRGYHIERLTATRLINCNAERRGTITEILVTNY